MRLSFDGDLWGIVIHVLKRQPALPCFLNSFLSLASDLLLLFSTWRFLNRNKERAESDPALQASKTYVKEIAKFLLESITQFACKFLTARRSQANKRE